MSKPAQVVRDVSLKLRATQALLSSLPTPRSAYWSRLIAARAAQQARVGGESQEWDLAAANWLDRVYTAVSDEATRVRKEGTAALAETTSAVGYGLWPLALVALAIGYAVAMGKRR